MTTLVAGCGYVGAPLARLLAARGEPVLALRRSPEPLEAAGWLRTLAVDLTDAAATREALAGWSIDRMVYLVSPDERSDAAYERAYVTGLGNAIAALPLLRDAVLVGSTGVYDTVTDGRWVDERMPTPGAGFAARRLAQGERLLQARVPFARVLRLGGIYGPERTRMVRSVLDGDARRPMVETFTNRIHRDDAARAAIHLLEAEPGIYLGVDHAQAPLADVQRWIAERAGVPVPPPATEPSMRRSRKRCDGGKLRRSGFSFAYPTYREGYAPIVDALVGR
jgi:nucleoside-diphosphate-sugar epimerase